MIDTGGKGDERHIYKHHSIAKFKSLPSLKKKGISTIDYLIISQPHADHMGELLYLFETLNIKTIILNSDKFTTSILMQIKSQSSEKHIKLMDVKQIFQLNVNDAQLKFFHTYINNSDDKNEQSIIILIQCKNRNILLMGDATVNNEQKLINNYQLPKIDILKVGHHGSRANSSKEFIKVIKPTISLISSGKNNKYRLHIYDVIDRLKTYGSKVFDTQNNGELKINLNENSFKVYRYILNRETLAREVTQ